MKPHVATLFALLFALFLLIGCDRNKNFETRTFLYNDILFSLTLEEKHMAIYSQKILYFAEQLESEIIKDEIAVSKAKIGEKVPVSAHFQNLYTISKKYHEESGGLFDPTIATISYCYKSGEATYKRPSEKVLSDAKENSGLKYLKVENGHAIKERDLKIDFWTMKSGYVADLATKFLKDSGVNNFIINIDGDMIINGNKSSRPFFVGIPKPERPSEIITTIKLENKGIATNALYKRDLHTEEIDKEVDLIFYGDKLKEKVNHASVSVISESATTADIFATVYHLLPISKIEEICKEKGTPTLVITNDGTQYKLCNWQEYEIR